MKKAILTLVLTISLAAVASAQGFEVIMEASGKKILKGIISRDDIEKDTSYSWYAPNQKGYNPNSEALAAFRQYKDSIQLLVFMGTWCGDSHYIIPRFYALTDAAVFPQDRITLIGVDRSKKTLSHLTEALDVKNVPTIIVMKNGRELGRVVEYGKFGMFDKELGDIIRSGF
jgi:hypothetical protein